MKLSRVLFAGIVALSLVPVPSAIAQGGDHAELFEMLEPGLFTVEIVDRDSGNRAAQGSAFALDDSGLLATNYHVVSEFLLHPDRYRLRFRDTRGDSGALDLIEVDVLHDLALVRLDPSVYEGADQIRAFDLARELPRNGDPVIALGNPWSIGISLVPGTYNGLLDQQFRKNIHFTGALNPGMSGGPTVNPDGEVIGINVAGAGNSVSFLVPTGRLAELLDRSQRLPQSFDDMRAGTIEKILEHQAEMIDELLAGDWTREPFGPLLIPREVRPWISCSGSSSEPDSETPWQISTSECALEDRIFLSRGLDTGSLEMLFGWYRSEGLNSFQFARVFAQINFVPFNRSSEDDVTEFECREGWVEIENLEPVAFKASHCMRAYLDYPDLYDVLYVARAQLPGSEAVFLHYTLAGVARDKAMQFHEHFLGSVAWK